MTRQFNFSAGPAALPDPVLQQAQQELLDFQGIGASVMEISHRSAEFIAIAEKAEQDLRDLLNISSDYAVLFLHGGASMQFAALPLNLLGNKTRVDYLHTGHWSSKAIKEAERFATVNVVASSQNTQFTTIPDKNDWQTSDDAAYLHYTDNETIAGVAFFDIPEVSAPLVADMSSSILSRPIDVNRFGVIYAGAQKNIGPAGLAIVIIRKDLLGQAAPHCPALLNYQIAADHASMYNTPPVFAWYMAGLAFQWLKDQGGLSAMEAINRRKAEKLYHYIDRSNFYSNPVESMCRSWMNIPFTLAKPELDKTFLTQSKQAGLLNLKGHRSVGGMRASIYNAVPEAAIDALIDFMQDFERHHE